VVHDEPNDQQSAQHSQTDGSRRRFLAGSAGVLGTLTLGSAFGSGSALAQEGEEGTDPGGDAATGGFESDIEILNYALTLEHLEAAFYREGLSNIDRTDLVEADGLSYFSEFPEAVQTRLYEQLGVIRDHEETHVEALTSLVRDVGGEPVEAPAFDFGSAVEDPTEFVQTAVELEDTGVGAYAGAAPFLENDGFLVPALSVHSVEARHASFVRTLAGESPSENAFDPALDEPEVIDRVNEYVAGEALEASTSGNTTAGDGTGGNGTPGNAPDGNSSGGAGADNGNGP